MKSIQEPKTKHFKSFMVFINSEKFGSHWTSEKSRRYFMNAQKRRMQPFCVPVCFVCCVPFWNVEVTFWYAYLYFCKRMQVAENTNTTINKLQIQKSIWPMSFNYLVGLRVLNLSFFSWSAQLVVRIWRNIDYRK